MSDGHNSLLHMSSVTLDSGGMDLHQDSWGLNQSEQGAKASYIRISPLHFLTPPGLLALLSTHVLSIAFWFPLLTCSSSYRARFDTHDCRSALYPTPVFDLCFRTAPIDCDIINRIPDKPIPASIYHPIP